MTNLAVPLPLPSSIRIHLHTRRASIKMQADDKIDEKHDLEAHPSPIIADAADEGTAEAVKAKRLQTESTFFRKLRFGEEWLDAKMGIEMQGIDRIPDEEKQPPSTWNVSWPPFLFCLGVIEIGANPSGRSSSCGGP